MTKEEVLERAISHFKGLAYPEPHEIVEFTLGEIRRHNEECAKICEVKCTVPPVLRLCHERDAKKIREASPK